MWPHRRQPTRLHHPWDSPGKNTGVGCHFLFQCMKVKLLSCVRLFATPWTAAFQAPPSMGFSRQEYWEWVAIAFSENTQEQGHIRIWATPTAGLEISTVLEGTLGRWGGLCLLARERTLTAVTQEKHVLFSCLDCSVDSFWFFSFFPFFLLLCCSCWFYWHYEIYLSFWALFFPQSHFLLFL